MDEIVTVATYHRGVADIVVSSAIVGQPPLDNFLGAILYRIGLAGSDWWVRFPAAVFGAGGVLLLGLSVGRFAGVRAGIASASLLAVCPLHVAMSQETRPYALTFFLCLASILTFARARSRQTVAAWIAFSATIFLLLMTRWTDPHFVVFGIVVYSAATWLRSLGNLAERPHETKRLTRTAAALSAAYALYSPFFWIVLANSRGAIDPGVTSWNEQFRRMLVQSFTALFAGYSERTVFLAQPGEPWILAVGAALTLLGVGVLLVRSRRGREEASGSGLFLCVLLPFPFLYAAVFAQLATAIPKPQYLLLMAALVCVGIGVGLGTLHDWLGTRRRVIGTFAYALAGLAVACPMAKASLDGLQRVDNRDWRGAMRYLSSHAHPGDVAVTLASDTVPPVFVPIAYGKERYGAEFLKFVPIRQTTTLEAFDADVWQTSKNTVWLLVYTDRMYLGFDQVPPPAAAAGMQVHAFDGLFLVSVPAGRSAMDRLLDGIDAIYKDLPDGRAFIAPAILRSEIAARAGEIDEAEKWFDRALRQCRPGDDVDFLTRNYSPSPRRLAASEGSSAAAP